MTPGSSHRRKRILVTLVAVWGLLLQSLMLAPLGVTTASAAASDSTTGQFHTIVICTGRGFVQITVDGDGNVVDQDDDQTGDVQDWQCPMCTLGNAALPPRVDDTFPAPPFASSLRLPAPVFELPEADALRTHLQARAPPRQVS